jgi:O-antigen ligase
LSFLTNWKFHMTKNIGNIERIIRIVGGLVLIALAATGTVGVWGWLGLVPLATGLVGWCPPYSLLGINTCKNKNT